jgi:hypothetical protein
MSLFTKRAAPLVLRNYELLFKRHVSQKAFKRSVKQAFKEEDWNKNWHNFPYAASAVKDIFNMRNTSPKEFSFIIKPTINWEYCFAFNTFYYRQEDIAEFDDTLQRQALGHAEKKRLHWNIMKDGMTTKQQHVLLVKGIIGHELQHAFDRDQLLLLLHASVAFHSQDKKYQILKELEHKADTYASQDPAVLEVLAKFFMHQHLLHIKNQELDQESKQHPSCLERAQYFFELSKLRMKK